MTDWPEAGRKADAHRVRDLYRAAFLSAAKGVARQRVIETLVAAGGTTVLDLWGGGLSARQMVSAGLRVISVDHGGLDLEDRGHPVKSSRKRAALERAANEDGYEARWGKAAKFAHEADVAFLDFCGPYTPEVRRTIEACRHMKAIAVTLVADHDLYSGALLPKERVAGYGAWLQMAYRPSSNRQFGVGRASRATPCRLLARYKRAGGQPVYIFLLAQVRIPLRHFTGAERRQIDPEYRARTNRQQAAYQRMKRASDPEYKARQYARVAEWMARKLKSDPDYLNRLARNRRAKRKAHLSSS